MIIGTGVDITEVRRLHQAVEKWGEDFLRRVFTETELKNAKSRMTSSYYQQSYYQHLAGRFAAKEAVFKAMGDPRLGWKEVQIINDKQGKPHCQILGKKGTGIDVHVSISHVKTYAVANAIVSEKP